MFYSQDILQKRGGKFGKIWLAATRMCKLTRREIASISVSKSCDEVLEYVEKRVLPLRPGEKRPRFSLYLSAQLMYGLIRIHEKQIHFLLTDASNTFVKVKMMPVHDIDLQEMPRLDIVTQPDIDQYASMQIETTIDQFPELQDYDSNLKKQYWSQNSGSDRSSSKGSRRSRSSVKRSADDENVVPTVSIEQITLVDPPSILVNTPLSPIPVPRDEELPPMNGQELDMFLEMIPEIGLTVEDLLPTSTPLPKELDRQTRSTEEKSASLEEPRETTPSKSSSVSGAPRSRAVPPSPGVTQQILTSPLVRPRRPLRASLQLELTPLTPSPSRKRQKRQLVFADKETQIPKTDMKQNLISSSDIRRNFELINPQAELPAALFKRPSRKGNRPEIKTGIWAGTTKFRPNIPEEEIPAIESSFSSVEDRDVQEARDFLGDHAVQRDPSLIDIDRIQLDADITIPEMQPNTSFNVPDPEFKEPTATPFITPIEGNRRRGRKRTLEESVERLRKTGESSDLHGSRVETPSFEQQRDASTSLLAGSLNLDDTLTLDNSRKSKDRSTSKRKPMTSRSISEDVSITDNLSENVAPSHPSSKSTMLYDLQEESFIHNQSLRVQTPIELQDNQEIVLNKIAEHLMDQDITTFREICPPEHTNKMAAAHYFTVLLDLVAQNRLEVEQRESFEDIYIRFQD